MMGWGHSSFTLSWYKEILTYKVKGQMEIKWSCIFSVERSFKTHWADHVVRIANYSATVFSYVSLDFLIHLSCPVNDQWMDIGSSSKFLNILYLWPGECLSHCTFSFWKIKFLFWQSHMLYHELCILIVLNSSLSPLLPSHVYSCFPY